MFRLFCFVLLWWSSSHGTAIRKIASNAKPSIQKVSAGMCISLCVQVQGRCTGTRSAAQLQSGKPSLLTCGTLVLPGRENGGRSPSLLSCGGLSLSLYSSRKALMGSMRAAYRAGTKHEANPLVHSVGGGALGVILPWPER
jgi:hypothetical protein